MFPRTFLFAEISALSLILTTGCSETPVKKESPDATAGVKEAPAVIGTHYTTIVFDPGKSNLSSESKKSIKKLMDRAHRSKKSIEEIHVLAWSDKEYPEEKTAKISTSDISLASNRAEKIRDYLLEDLNETEDVDAYNMAKRPDLISKVLRNNEYVVKKAFDMSGVSASKLPDGSVSYTKANKALVIIDYVGDEDNLK